MNDAGSRKALIHPVVLSGGSGSRLWPLSREHYPKQLLPLIGARTMIQDTALRVAGHSGFAQPLIVCGHEHRFLIAQQLQDTGITPAAIVLEPFGRDTAAAAAVAALMVADQDPEGLVLLMPADHSIADPAGFREAVATAAPAARGGAIVTFGIVPSRPETGYGYIKRGGPLADHPGVFAVDSFVEKPQLETAKQMLAGGQHLWNGGLFLFSAATLAQELAAHAPEILKACRAAVSGGQTDLDFFRLEVEAFSSSPAISLDYAVMERTDRAAVVPVDFGWTDVGSWTVLWELAEQDAAGNAAIGNVILHDTRNTYARSDGPLTAVVGLDDLLVVTVNDAVLVCAKDRAQDVKAVVERLKADDRPEARAHSRVYRPWGFYQSLHMGDRFQVKRLTVNPGARLSLQQHYHRAEHWVVVNGTALVTRDGEDVLVRENESIYLPLGTVHRVSNPGKVPLNLIEVQSGAYLGEDDIVRFEDDYARN